MLRFDNTTYLSLLLKSILHERLGNSQWGLDVLLCIEFINIVSILYYNFNEFSILLYTFLVNYFARYKEYMVWRISFSQFPDVLAAFNYARAICDLWIVCLEDFAKVLMEIFHFWKH